MDHRIEAEIDAFTAIYSERVLATRTRRIELLGRRCEPQIMKGFLGYELKLQKKRIACPDMVTARYLRIFAALGIASVAIPYNPTETAAVLPELEETMRRIRTLTLEEDEVGRTPKGRLARLFRKIRNRITSAEVQAKGSS